jgi:hypothetical protein
MSRSKTDFCIQYLTKDKHNVIVRKNTENAGTFMITLQKFKSTGWRKKNTFFKWVVVGRVKVGDLPTLPENSAEGPVQ